MNNLISPKPKLLIGLTVDQTLGFLKDQLTFLSTYFEIVVISGRSPDGRLDLDNFSFKVYIYPIHRSISPFADIKSLVLILHFLLTFRPNIVHSFTPKAGLLFMIGSFLLRVPIRIHTFTGLLFPTFFGFKKFIFKFFDFFTDIEFIFVV